MTKFRSVRVLVAGVGLVGLSGCFAPAKPESGALLEAVAKGNHARVLELLKQGADVNESSAPAGSAERVTPLMVAVVTRQPQIVQTLILNGASQHPSVMGYSALDLALEDGNDEVVRALGLQAKGVR